MRFWNDFVLPILLNIYSGVVETVPNIFRAAVLLLIGWLVAKALQKVVHQLLRRLGFNKLAEKAGIMDFLTSAGFKHRPAWIVGRLVYWMLLFIFFRSAAETLKWPALAQTLEKVVAFMPKLIAVVFILIFGAMFARFVGRIVQASASNSGIDFSAILGRLVSSVIIMAIIIVAISQLDIEVDALDIIFAVLVGAFGLAVALMLGLGTTKIAQNIISGLYARRSLMSGQNIEINGIEGKIVAIGTVNTVVENASGRVLLPNALLMEQITHIKKSKPAKA